VRSNRVHAESAPNTDARVFPERSKAPGKLRNTAAAREPHSGINLADVEFTWACQCPHKPTSGISSPGLDEAERAMSFSSSAAIAADSLSTSSSASRFIFS